MFELKIARLGLCSLSKEMREGGSSATNCQVELDPQCPLMFEAKFSVWALCKLYSTNFESLLMNLNSIRTI